MGTVTAAGRAPFATEAELAEGAGAPLVYVGREQDLAHAARMLGLGQTATCIVVVGGASGMADAALARAEPLFSRAIVLVAERLGATVLDGGTDAGVMRLGGRARSAAGASFPLVGVFPARLPAKGNAVVPLDDEPLEPNHTHFLAVPGTTWGDEGRWLDALAAKLAPRSATVLIDGGVIAWQEVERSVRSGRPVLAVAGTGRAADTFAGASTGKRVERRARELAEGGLVHTTDAGDPDQLAGALLQLLGRGVD